MAAIELYAAVADFISTTVPLRNRTFSTSLSNDASSTISDADTRRDARTAVCGARREQDSLSLVPPSVADLQSLCRPAGMDGALLTFCSLHVAGCSALA